MLLSDIKPPPLAQAARELLDSRSHASPVQQHKNRTEPEPRDATPPQPLGYLVVALWKVPGYQQHEQEQRSHRGARKNLTRGRYPRQLDVLVILTVDTGDDRGHVLGVHAVEVQVHLARRPDRRALRRWERWCGHARIRSYPVLSPGGLVFGGIWSAPSSRRIAASSSPRMPAVRASIRIRASSERNRPGFTSTGHASANSSSYNPRTFGLANTEPLAKPGPLRGRQPRVGLGEHLAHPGSVAARDNGEVELLGARLHEHVHI
jgi:hypothetical protein